ncbi:MAG: hypothetical protein ACXWIU_05515 [Limisphaerales bacterium]
MRAKHVFLILTVVSAVLGFIPSDSMYLDLGRPLAAIFFGLFLITMVLEKESDLLDQQLATANTSAGRVSKKSDREVAANPALTHAHSH